MLKPKVKVAVKGKDGEEKRSVSKVSTIASKQTYMHNLHPLTPL